MKPLSFKAINCEAMSADKMPKKTVKKWKKKDRQDAKRRIRKGLNESVKKG